MNNISIMGRLTADPKCECTANGNFVLHFKVAVPRPHVKDTTDFIRCVAWRNTAEFIEKWFTKGKMIAITGCLTSRSWKDNENKNHTIHEVLVDQVDFCGDKSSVQKQQEPVSDQQAIDNMEQQLGAKVDEITEYTQEDIPF